MSENFRIPRFMSSALLVFEELILLAGVWLYSDLDINVQILISVFCIFTQTVIHFIKDESKKAYITVDFIFVWMVNIIMGIVYRNMYVSLVCTFFYYMKSIFFRNKRLVLGRLIVDTITVISGHFMPVPENIVTFDVFVTYFVCLAQVLVTLLTFQLISQIDTMLNDAIEQETSLDDLLYVVDNKVKEAEQANKAKSNFLANMSHEIRTPINAVLGLDTMILRESKEKNIRKYASDIQSSGRSLLSLINDILDFSKIESGKMELICADYDITSIVNDVVNMIRPKAVDKELFFEIDIDENIPCGLYGDDVRIRQIIVNLLTNAVKYTHMGGVKLSIKSTIDGENARLLVSVRDTGIGIKPEDIDKLYEEFVRIEESRNKNIEGTGLGINIVISLLKLMGSKLNVDSEYGVGSNFYFELIQPIKNIEPIGNINQRLMQIDDDDEFVVSFNIPDCKLLVVDDNAMNRNVFCNLLKDMQCQIDEADSGKACLELVKNNKYDIIFMDHMMPEMDGIETLHHMNEMESNLNKDTPVIILTANAISGARELYMSEGFNDYLTKPIDYDKLEAMIGTLVPEDKKQQVVKRADENEEEAIEYTDLPFVDGIDWQSAMLKLRSEQLLKDSINSFSMMAKPDMQMLKEMYGRLVAGMSDESFDEYRIKVHSMKSNVATIGAYHVAGLAKYLEYGARDKDINVINNLMTLFEKEWLGLKNAVDEAFGLATEDDGNLPLIDKAELTELLGALKEAMDEFDYDRADAIVEKFSKYSYNEQEKEYFEKVKYAVLNLDGDLCSEIIDKWCDVV